MSSQQHSGKAVAEDSHDRVFYLTFSAILGALVLLTLVIVAIANSLYAEDETDPLRVQQIAERIAPLGSVYTDKNAIPKAAPVEVAAVRSASQVVSSVCSGCHLAGVLGAVKLDDGPGWQAKLDAAGGIDALTASVINGKGAMPARGGDSSLTDAEIRSAVEAILAGAGL